MLRSQGGCAPCTQESREIDLCGNRKLKAEPTACLLLLWAASALAWQKLLMSMISVFRNSSHMGTSPAMPPTVEPPGSG